VASKEPSAWRRLLEAFFDRIAIRPLTLLVFLLSAGALLALHFGHSRALSLPAVAVAIPIEHPSLFDSVVAAVHVVPGDIVAPGVALVTLTPRWLEQELLAVDAQMLQVESRLGLERAKTVLDRDEVRDDLRRRVSQAERDLRQAEADEAGRRVLLKVTERNLEQVRSLVEARTLRAEELRTAEILRDETRAALNVASQEVQAARTHLETMREINAAPSHAAHLPELTVAYYAAEIEVLRVQRERILRDLEASTVRAQAHGRVAVVLPVGAAAQTGVSVATLMPEVASEVVAYLPIDGGTAGVEIGAPVRLSDRHGSCAALGQVVRFGATVEMAPEHLMNLFRFPIYGLPLYVSVPGSCVLAVGQRVQVEVDEAWR